jgi:hypothetical protein
LESSAHLQGISAEAEEKGKRKKRSGKRQRKEIAAGTEMSEGTGTSNESPVVQTKRQA